MKFVQGGSGKAPQAFRAQPETGGEAAETAERIRIRITDDVEFVG